VTEMGIWKTLRHVNVLELYGGSSASGDPPWFFVSPYYKRGSLVKYLKGLVVASHNGGNKSGSEGGRGRSVGRSENERVADGVDMLKMMYEIAKGMEYLHGMGVLHGDLKVCCFLAHLFLNSDSLLVFICVIFRVRMCSWMTRLGV
jgi:abelson tyrosine-protein kinase 1